MTSTDTVPEFPLHYRLRLSLDESNVTPDDMAAELACHVNTVHNYLTGRTRPRRPIIAAWALKTGTPFEWLETGRTPDTPTSRCNGALRWQPYPPPRIAA